jgi:hypothetical protein
MPQSLYPAVEKSVKKGGGFHEPLAHDLKDEDLSDWHIVNCCIDKLNARSGSTASAAASEELYDHRADPYEWKNLAARADLAGTKRELAALLPTKNHPPTKQGGGRTENQ